VDGRGRDVLAKLAWQAGAAGCKVAHCVCVGCQYQQQRSLNAGDGEPGSERRATARQHTVQLSRTPAVAAQECTQASVGRRSTAGRPSARSRS
jgi:hypothetical protein